MKIKKDKVWLLLAFLFPVAVMMVLFVAKHIYPFGSNSFLSGDLYHQYMPFFSEFMRKVKAGEGFDFSYNVGIGSNFTALFVYYLASPLHALAFLFPEKYLIEFIGYLIVIKTGLAGLTAAIYLKNHFKTNSPAIIGFSLFYAFSGFMAAYNYNIMWVDCVWLFPLIILGLERLVQEGKGGLYCITLSLSILTNFYISIMICIFLVLYFGILFINSRGKWLRSIGLFAMYSLLAGGMASILLVPGISALMSTDFGAMEFPQTIKSYFSVLDMLARHCVCVFNERGLDHWPNIYCGSVVIMLLPMYLMNRKISVREKFTKLALMGFMLLSFSTNILDFIWHGMNYPDSLPARQSFAYCFLVLIMCYEAFHKVHEADEQQIVYGYVAAVAFFLFCEKFITHEDFDKGVKLLTLGFITIYAIFLYLYRTRKSKDTLCIIAIVAIAVALVEVGFNTYDTSIGTTSRTSYLAKQDDYKNLYELTKNREDGFYRVEKFTRKTKNDGTLTGYPTASVFSSTLNSYVKDMYKTLGMRYSKVYYSFDGATAFTSALLNVNYMFGEKNDYSSDLYSLVETSGDISLYESVYTLPFGYVAPFGYDIPAGEDYEYKAFALQNEMINNLGVEGKAFLKQSREKEGDDIFFEALRDGVYYGIVTAGGTGKIKIQGGSRDKDVLPDLKKGCILYLGQMKKGETIVLTNGDEKDETPAISVDIYRVDVEKIEAAMEILSRQSMTLEKMEADSIKGSIHMEKAGSLILSVPYEEGWKITVNGKPAKGRMFGNALVAFDLVPGDYELEMQYRAKNANLGILGSIVSIALFVLAICLFNRKKKNTYGELSISEDVSECAEDEAIGVEELLMQEDGYRYDEDEVKGIEGADWETEPLEEIEDME